MHIAFVGHLCIDQNVIQGTESRLYGGGVLHGAITAKRLGADSRLYTCCAPRDRRHFSSLAEAEVDAVFLPSPETTSIRNEYPSEDPDDRRSSLIARARPFAVDDLQLVEGCEVLHVNPLWFGEFPPALLAAAKTRTRALAGDAQGLLRNASASGALILQDLPDKEQLLPLFDFLKADMTEAEILTGRSDVRRAAARLCELGVGTSVLTHRAGVCVCDGHEIHEAPFTACTPEGRTGRGDTCMAAFLVARQSGSIAQATSVAAAVTSEKMQRPGPYRGKARTG